MCYAIKELFGHWHSRHQAKFETMMIYRADSMLAPGQWETALQSNAVSHWLGANVESNLIYFYFMEMKRIIPAVHSTITGLNPFRRAVVIAIHHMKWHHADGRPHS